MSGGRDLKPRHGHCTDALGRRYATALYWRVVDSVTGNLVDEVTVTK